MHYTRVIFIAHTECVVYNYSRCGGVVHIYTVYYK